MYIGEKKLNVPDITHPMKTMCWQLPTFLAMRLIKAINDTKAATNGRNNHLGKTANILLLNFLQQILFSNFAVVGQSKILLPGE